MLIAVFFVILFLALVLSVFNMKYSLGLMIAYRLLVPYSSFQFSSIPIEYNYILLLIFCIFLFRVAFLNHEPFDRRIIMPFAIFTFIIIIGSFFSDGVDFTFQIASLRSYIIGYFLIPIMLWQVCKTKSDFNFFARIIIICLSIMLIYGLFCFLTGQNPYIAALSELFNKQDNNEIFSEIERGGLTGKVQSTTSHPMLWSVVLSLIIFASNSLWLRKKNYTFYIFVALVLFNLFVCNVRTGIVATVIGLAILFTQFSFRYKLISISFILVLLLLSADTSIFGSFQPFVDSIIYFSDTDKNVGGSSLEMRMVQFGGAVSLWEQGGILFGNGFNWCGNYYALYGDHPILLAFESIIYVIIIENGVLGIIIYGFLFYSFYKINWDLYLSLQKKNKTEYWLINSLITTYIIYIMITGLFGFNFFLIFLVLMYVKNRLTLINDDEQIFLF